MTIYIIYQIVCKDETDTDTYVGITTEFKIRRDQHKTTCNNPKSKNHNIKVYKFMRLNGGFNNFKFIILKEIECNDKYDAYKNEQQYINELKSELNCISPYTGLTKQEYLKIYRQLNYDKLNKNCNCDCGGKYNLKHKGRHFNTKKHLKYYIVL